MNDLQYTCIDEAGRVELGLTLDDAYSASQPGKDASDDVDALLELPYVAEQVAQWSADDLRRGLKVCGAWDDGELADHAENIRRAVWLAACNIRDEQP